MARSKNKDNYENITNVTKEVLKSNEKEKKEFGYCPSGPYLNFDEENIDSILARKEEINPNLKEKLLCIANRIKRFNEIEISERYSLGKELLEIIENKTIYGLNSPAEIYQYLPIYRDGIRQMVIVAKRFTEEDIKNLMKLENPITKEKLTWSHIFALSAIPDNIMVFDLAKQCVDNGWSQYDLNSKIRVIYSGRFSRSNDIITRVGRKQRSFKAFEGLLDDLDNKSQYFAKRANMWMMGLRKLDFDIKYLLENRMLVAAHDSMLKIIKRIESIVDNLHDIHRDIVEKRKLLSKYIDGEIDLPLDKQISEDEIEDILGGVAIYEQND